MALYPVALCLTGRLCVVIGAGEVAARKINALLEVGARVKVIAPDEPHCDGIEHVRRRYCRGDLQGAFLAIAATDDREVNEEVFREADRLNIPVNVVDKPLLCTFHVPSVMTRGDLQISVSTGGKCPALAKKIRHQIEALYGPEYEDYLKVIEEVRQYMRGAFEAENRRVLLNLVLDDASILELVRKKKLEEAREKLRQLLRDREISF
jgi:precorrin-2 dehydrogenase / sirohydrochlorin ferrochelatase